MKDVLLPLLYTFLVDSISYLVLVFLLLALNIVHMHVHFNNRYTSNHQWIGGPGKDVFAFTVAFQSIPKRAINQFQESLRKRFPRNLAPINKQMLASKFIKRGLYSRRFA